MYPVIQKQDWESAANPLVFLRQERGQGVRSNCAALFIQLYQPLSFIGIDEVFSYVIADLLESGPPFRGREQC